MAISPDTVGRYPQSTPGGQAIPFEIVRPLGLLIKSFNAVAASDIAIPAGADFLILRSIDGPCYIGLDVTAVAPTDGVHAVGIVYIGEDEVLVIDHNTAAEISVIRASAANGTLIVQTCSKYTDIRKSAQLERS